MGRGFGSPMSALIVQTDRVEAELGAAALEALGLRVQRVSTAEEAIEHLLGLSGQITVLLADHDLPGAMDGAALVWRVSVLWPGISAVLMSVDTDERALDLPARTTRLRRPWRPLDIVAAAERASRADHSVHAVRL